MPPDDDRAGFHLLVDGNKPLEADCLAAIFLRLLHKIAVKEGVILILDLNDGSVDIVRERIDDLIVFCLPAEIFIDDTGTARHTADDLVILLFRIFPAKTVKDDHIGVLYLVEYELAHILVVLQKCRCVKERHHLRDRPALRHCVEKFLQFQHAVIFDAHTLHAVLFLQFFQFFGRHFLGIEKSDLKIAYGKTGGVILLLALLQYEQQRAFARIEPLVLKGLLYKLRLSGFQKS